MNIHEYQAKAVLKQFGVPVSRGVAVLDASQAEAAARELGGPLWVVKSQIHAGGRGKGKFKEPEAGEKGGVRLSKSIDEVVAKNPDKVADAKTNPKAIGWFVGQVMKSSGGKANPQAVNDLLKKKLGL